MHRKQEVAFKNTKRMEVCLFGLQVNSWTRPFLKMELLWMYGNALHELMDGEDVNQNEGFKGTTTWGYLGFWFPT